MSRFTLHSQVLADSRDVVCSRPVVLVWADASDEKLPQPRLLDLSKEILVHIIGPTPKEVPTG